jgi:hypothetical protein
VPAAALLPETDVHWLGPLLAYLAGWAFEQKININIKASFWFSRGCSGSSARAVSFLLIRGGLLHPLLLVFAPLLRLEHTRCQLSYYLWGVAAPPPF